jgi:hypothetical protein
MLYAEFRGVDIKEVPRRVNEQLLCAAVRHPDLKNYPDWMKIDGDSSEEWCDALRETWTQLLELASVETVTGSQVSELVDGVLSRLLPMDTCVTPCLPDPARWRRRALVGRWVAIMDHRRRSRGMVLTSWTTRAVRTGEMHEFVATPVNPSEEGRVDDVLYLGFAELESG